MDNETQSYWRQAAAALYRPDGSFRGENHATAVVAQLIEQLARQGETPDTTGTAAGR